MDFKLLCYTKIEIRQQLIFVLLLVFFLSK